MGVEITPQTITGGVATVTDTASLYISAAPTATVTGANYALWVDDGAVRIGQNDWLLGKDSAGTGNVSMFKVNASDQVQVGGALSIDGGITLPTDAGAVTLVDLPLGTSVQGTDQSYSFQIGSDNILTVFGENGAT